MYTLPTADGSSGQVLQTNGSAILSWAAPGDMTTTTNQTVTGEKTFGVAGNVGKLKIAGVTSGTATINAAAIAGSSVFTLPQTTGTIATLNALNQQFTSSTFFNGGLSVNGVGVTGFFLVNNTFANAYANIQNPAASSIATTILLPSVSDTLVGLVSTQTLTNKTIGAGGLTFIAGADITINATTGTKIGQAGSRIALFGATPDLRPTNTITASAFVANTSLIANDTATFGGYTIGQIAAALIRLGALT